MGMVEGGGDGDEFGVVAVYGELVGEVCRRGGMEEGGVEAGLGESQV